MKRLNTYDNNTDKIHTTKITKKKKDNEQKEQNKKVELIKKALIENFINNNEDEWCETVLAIINSHKLFSCNYCSSQDKNMIFCGKCKKNICYTCCFNCSCNSIRQTETAQNVICFSCKEWPCTQTFEDCQKDLSEVCEGCEKISSM